MTGLSFLQPETASGAVIARSPAERRARAAGAAFERRGGWNVAVSYAAGAERERERLMQTVAFADRSDLVKLEIQSEPDALAAVLSDASGAVATIHPGLAVRTPSTWWCAVTPSRALVLAERQAGVEERIRSAAADVQSRSATVSIVNVSTGLAAMTLAGPGSSELLARFCAIDVRASATPVGAFRPGSVARTPGYLLRERADRLLVLVGWALGEYLWEVVADAAEHLGGGPVGADALNADAGNADA